MSRETIVRPRQSGKTTAALLWLHEDPDRVLYVLSEIEANRIKRENPDVRDQIRSWIRRYPGVHYTFGIDNVDHVIQSVPKPTPRNLIEVLAELDYIARASFWTYTD